MRCAGVRAAGPEDLTTANWTVSGDALAPREPFDVANHAQNHRRQACFARWTYQRGFAARLVKKKKKTTSLKLPVSYLVVLPLSLHLSHYRTRRSTFVF